MRSFPVPKARRSKRVVAKRRASLVIHLDRNPKRQSCLVLDSSKEGFRLCGSFDLRRGQLVELIFDEGTPSAERCSVVWGFHGQIPKGGNTLRHGGRNR